MPYAILISLCSILIGSQLSFANAKSEAMFEGVNISPLVEIFQKQIFKLKQPVTVYNWSGNGAKGDSSNLQLAQSGATTFWRAFGSSEGAYNMYGSGLYAAVDPIVTRSYGGSEWLLIEMKLPIGFNLLDLSSPPIIEDKLLVSKAYQVESHFNCPNSEGAQVFFESGGSKLSRDCIRLIKYIFSHILEVDGFSYSYSDTRFKACKQKIDASVAFVMIRDGWMQPNLINYYNKASTHNLENRIIIQTLFSVNRVESINLSEQARGKMVRYLTDHPDFEYRKLISQCAGLFCTLKVEFCNPGSFCEQLELDIVPRPGGPNINAAEYGPYSPSFLWNDLEGKSKSTITTSWLRENKYGCSGQLPY